MADQKPEAAYFLASNGKRTALLVVDMKDASQIPALAEPWFLAFKASLEVVPVMVTESEKSRARHREGDQRSTGKVYLPPANAFFSGHSSPIGFSLSISAQQFLGSLGQNTSNLPPFPLTLGIFIES